MRSAITTTLAIGLAIAASPVLADEAASALAECQAHQQRLAQLEEDYAPQPDMGTNANYSTSRPFRANEIDQERDLMERTCDYARGLRQASQPARAQPRFSAPQFRSDEPAPTTPASAPPYRKSTPAQVVTQPPPPQPPRAVMRRPPASPAQATVGGTKARHEPDEQPAQAPAQ